MNKLILKFVENQIPIFQDVMILGI